MDSLNLQIQKKQFSLKKKQKNKNSKIDWVTTAHWANEKKVTLKQAGEAGTQSCHKSYSATPGKNLKPRDSPWWVKSLNPKSGTSDFKTYI